MPSRDAKKGWPGSVNHAISLPLAFTVESQKKHSSTKTSIRKQYAMQLDAVDDIQTAVDAGRI